MRVSELIARLAAIQAEHGDVLVTHHDDWDDFYVEKVEYEPAVYEPPSYHEPARVLIRGERYSVDQEQEFLVAVGEPPAT